jgi:hypothetical protein
MICACAVIGISSAIMMIGGHTLRLFMVLSPAYWLSGYLTGGATIGSYPGITAQS